ncbi:PorV/PorQ family protein [candidate division GN15 bacterium]|nr:PorV/PorQ family protein [candidate division GN15 bacterium]
MIQLSHTRHARSFHGARVIGLVTVLLVLMATAVQAGDAGRESPFLLGSGSRSLGMGGGLTALSSDASAVYYNPAGLAGLRYQQLSFQHSVLFEHSIYDVGTWVYPVNENHGLGISFMRLGTADIIRRVDFARDGEFDYSHSQMLFAYGRNIGEPFTVGVTLKIVNQALDDFSDFAVGADVGWRLHFGEHVSVGAIARDLIPAKLQLDSTSERTPMSAMGGVALHDIAISDYVKFAATLDLERVEDREFNIHAGGEVTLHDHYAFRLGYDRDDVAFGAGLQYGRLHVDYAYKLVEYVEDIHHFTLSLDLGKSIEEQIRLRELAKLPPEPTEEEKRFAALVDSANYYMHRFQLDSASAYFRLALDIEPDNQEIIGSLAAIAEARRVQEDQEQRLQEAQAELNQTVNSFLTQAELLFAKRSYAASLDLLELIFDIDPSNPRAQRLKRQIETAKADEIVSQLAEAETAVDENRLVSAIEAYNRVLEIDPDNAQARAAKQRVMATMDLPEKIRLGVEMFNQGQYSAARRQFREILEVNPDEAVAKDYLERIERQPVEPQPVQTSTLDDLQKDPEIWSLYLDGLRHMRNKEYQSAIDAWSKVLEKYPNNSNAQNNIEQARLRLKTEQPEE